MPPSVTERPEPEDADTGLDVVAVDDDPVFLALLRRRARGAGLSIETAGSADEGLARLRARRARLVLVDLRLGRASGTALVATLRAEGRLEGSRACIVSAAAPTRDALETIARVGAEFAAKEDALAEGGLARLLDGSPARP